MFDRLLGERRRTPSADGRVPPGQYLTEKFPVLHYGSVPSVDLATWDFRVHGQVDNPLHFSWAEFRALPRVAVTTDIHCVTRWSKLDTHWEGVSIRTIKDDAFTALEALHAAGEKFDAVIIDPPAFIKRRKDAPKGEAAYKRINQLAMQLLPRDGLLVSCSCSYHLESDALLDAIQRSGRHLSRFVQVLASGGQSPDHPVHPAIPETRYLKAFLCRVTHD